MHAYARHVRGCSRAGRTGPKSQPHDAVTCAEENTVKAREVLRVFWGVKLDSLEGPPTGKADRIAATRRARSGPAFPGTDT